MPNDSLSRTEGKMYDAPTAIQAFDPLECLARIGGWRSQRVVAVVHGFFDESGEFDSGNKLHRLTVGGFWATWGEIEKLSNKWRAALNDQALAEFHMKEFASDEHAYESWAAERQKRLDRFVDILCEHAAEFGAFNYPVVDEERAFTDAYEPAIARIMTVSSLMADRLHERGNIVFAKTEEIKGELIGRYFDSLHWDEFLDGYSVLRSRDCPALQAAEIVARGLKRLMQDGTLTHSFRRIRATLKFPPWGSEGNPVIGCLPPPGFRWQIVGKWPPNRRWDNLPEMDQVAPSAPSRRVVTKTKKTT